MKVMISYRPQEQKAATEVFKAARQLLPRARVHKAENRPPVVRLYLTTKSEPGEESID